jgi:AsmA family protein
MNRTSISHFVRSHPIWLAIAAALLLLILLFDWNWFRGPLERYISKKTERTFRISDLHVRLGFTPTIRMRDVYFSNAAWSKNEVMARIKELEFSVSLRDLPDKILVPRVAMTEPDIILERLKDDRKNWILSEPSDQSPSKLRISTLSVDHGRLRYFNHGDPFEIDVLASTFDAASQAKSRDADAAPANNRFTTSYKFSGKYHDAGFSGNALTGEVLSFQESGVPFPVKGRLVAGTTRVEVDGTIADAANISAIDTQLRIEGQTLANLYPFLLLPLPASPPYQLQGHLILKGDRFTMDDLAGKIGSTDVQGNGTYVNKKPRPLLTAHLRSKLLDISDLGPLVGVQTKLSGGKPAVSQVETKNRPAAKAKEKIVDPDHILPSGSFDGSRLQKIDADVDLDAAKLKAPVALPLESLRASLHLHDSILKLTPLEFGFAGGTIVSQVKLDARQPELKSDMQVNFNHIRVDRLIPASSSIAKGAGLLGATIQLNGAGNSIADAAAKSNGRISAAIANGRVSNLLDAASGLNGGKVLRLLAGGDQTISVNCGAIDFDIKNGQGKSTIFVVDTEQTQILGSGNFDLKQERFDLIVTPKPKRMGILSLRTPVQVFGSFKHADFKLEKGPLLARAGGAIALAAIAPLAALIPLIETGPGQTTDCSALHRKVGVAESKTPAAAKNK